MKHFNKNNKLNSFEGCIEAYILNTGELFWGDAKTIDELYNIVVQLMMLRKKENV